MLNSTGSLLYSPAAGFSGSDHFTYQASDATSLSNTATVSLTVTPAIPERDRGARASRPTRAFPASAA